MQLGGTLEMDRGEWQAMVTLAIRAKPKTEDEKSLHEQLKSHEVTLKSQSIHRVLIDVPPPF